MRTTLVASLRGCGSMRNVRRTLLHPFAALTLRDSMTTDDGVVIAPGSVLDVG